MRILELNFERTWRGGERQTLYDMLGFRELGQQVAVLCRNGYPLQQKAQAEGLEVLPFSNILGVLFFLLFKARKFDVFHVQTSHMLTWCVLTKPFHRAKIVFTRRLDFVPRKASTRIKYNLADHVVAISTAIKKILEDFGVKNVSLISESVIPKQLDKNRALKILDSLHLKPGTHILSTTSALVQHKDPLNMVEAIMHLKEKRQDFVFLHFGSGVMESEVKDKIAASGVGDVYKMMGFLDNVEDMFSIMEVFVMSSEEEGLGSSVLDAFAYKVPVVSTAAGGLKDLVKDGRGILCPRHSPQALADGIELLLNDPGFAAAIAERAYDYVVTEHAVSRISGQYLRLISEG